MAKGSLVSMILGSTTGDLTPAQQQAAALGDQQRARATAGEQETIALPTDALGDLVPQATRPTGTPEGIERVESQAEEGLLVLRDPTGGGVRQATPDQARQQYLGQLEAEQTQRPIDFEQGIVTFPVTDDGDFVTKVTQDIATAEFAFTNEGFVAAGNPESNLQMSALNKLGLSAPKTATGKTHLPKKGVGAAAYLAMMAALGNLNSERETKKMQDVADKQADRGIDYDNVTDNQDQGRHQFISKVADLFEHIVAGPASVDPVTGEAARAGGRSRLTPQEKTALGLYLTEVMKNGGFFQYFDTKDKDTKPVSTPTSYIQETVVYPGGVSTELEYGLTTQGQKMLNKMAPMIEAVFPDAKRRVSLTPLPLGTYIGEAAAQQKKRTKTPTHPKLSSTMLSAMDVMGTMPNIISTHKLEMTQMMVTDVRTKYDQAMQAAKQQVNFQERMAQMPPRDQWTQDHIEAFIDLQEELTAAEDAILPQMESPFAVLFGIDAKKLKKIEEASFRSTIKKSEVFWDAEAGLWRKKARNEGEESFPLYPDMQKKLNEKFPEDDRPTFDDPVMQPVSQSLRGEAGKKQSHRQFAKEVALGELSKAEQTLAQANEHAGHVFYYGVTAIGNSGRLMISQTELNYQASKLARFMIDNPRATKLVKGGQRDKSFRYLVARALIHGADTMQRKKLEEFFENQVADPNSEINELARQVYATTDKAGMTPEKRMELLGQIIQGANQGKYGFLDAGEWAHKGEWGFPLDALHEWGKYLATPDGAQMHTRLKVEVDGINNGSSIQGLQFGVDKILKSAGVEYDLDDEQVIPEGSLRDLLFNDIMTPTPDGEWPLFGMQDVPKRVADALGEDMMVALLNSVKNNGLKKKFVKIPLMTTIYGMPSDGHGDHFRAFVLENFDDFIEAGISPDNQAEVIAFFESVMKTGLEFTLKEALLHQQLIKQTAGFFWNLWDIIPQIEGPNGYMVPFGGDMMVPAGRMEVAIYDHNESGKKKKPRNVKLSVSDIEVTAATPKDGSLGKLARNHLAVNGTHNIDSTVAQETLIKAKERLGPTFWGQQVFDAFIGDLSSIETLLDVSNEVFYDINKRYNMIEEEYKAFQRDRKKFNQRVIEAQKRGEMWDTSEAGKYRFLRDFIQKSFAKKGEWQDHDAWTSLLAKKGISIKREPTGEKTEKGNDKMKTTLTMPDQMSPQDIQDLMMFTMRNWLGAMDKPINQAFADTVRSINKSREIAFARIVEDLIRQFN